MMNYNEIVEGLFFHTDHQGVITCDEPRTVGFSIPGAGKLAGCQLYLQCNEKGLIKKARFKAYGNPYLISGLEWICRQLQGTVLENSSYWTAQFFIELLDIPKYKQSAAFLLEDISTKTVNLMQEKFRSDDDPSNAS
jgi:nitrogen fixation NifU-like protein